KQIAPSPRPERFANSRYCSGATLESDESRVWTCRSAIIGWMLRRGERVAHLDMVLDRENSRDQENLRLHHETIGFRRHRAPQDDRVALHPEMHRRIALRVERAAQRYFPRLGMHRFGRTGSAAIGRPWNRAVAGSRVTVGRLRLRRMEHQVSDEKKSADHQRQRPRGMPPASVAMKDRTRISTRRSNLVEHDRPRLVRAAILRRQSSRYVGGAERAVVRIYRDCSAASRTFRIDLVAEQRRRRRGLCSGPDPGQRQLELWARRRPG